MMRPLVPITMNLVSGLGKPDGGLSSSSPMLVRVACTSPPRLKCGEKKYCAPSTPLTYQSLRLVLYSGLPPGEVGGGFCRLRVMPNRGPTYGTRAPRVLNDVRAPTPMRRLEKSELLVPLDPVVSVE